MSLGNIIFSILPLSIVLQSLVSKVMDTKPDVGTLSIKISPNLLTKSVMALLCPKRIKLSIAFGQDLTICSNLIPSKVYNSLLISIFPDEHFRLNQFDMKYYFQIF